MLASETEVELDLPRKLQPVFVDEPGEAIRYRGAYGGRGSAKTFSFAKMTAVKALEFAAAGISGIILCGREFMNSLDESSMAEVKAAITSEPWLAAHFDVGEKYIRTKPHLSGRVDYAFAGLRHNLDSIKSKSRILILWIDEAEPVTETAWRKITPTVRAESQKPEIGDEDTEAYFEWNSEIWITWNPESETSATHKRFRENPPRRAKIVEINWQENPWFPDVLNEERLEDQEKRPDQYDHVWGGDFVTVFEGAYFASNITKARADGRIEVVPEDPMMCVHLWSDIGGTGAKADNFVFWAGQFIGRQILYTNYYEVQGQPISAHLAWMRTQGYTPDVVKIWLPHDGDTNDKVYDVSYASAFRNLGYTVEVVPNQGKGAAKARIEKARNEFHRMSFDKVKCAAGLTRIGRYHSKKDKATGQDLGPDHDENSHGADAFGLSAVVYKEPAQTATIKVSAPRGAGGWMG